MHATARTRSLIGISLALLIGGCGVDPLEVIMETDGGANDAAAGAGGGFQTGGSGGAQGGQGGTATGGNTGSGGSATGGNTGSGGSATGGNTGSGGSASGGTGGSVGGSGGSTGGTGGIIEVGVGESCDGFRPAPLPVCKPALFCEHPAGSCRLADGSGKCVATNQPCDLILAPVCGCDGKTYSNDCARRNARVQLDHTGSCDRGVGQMCGGLAGLRCDAGLFCDQTAGTCKFADAGGTCQPIPVGCEKILRPVCGCDGNTYGNDCMRQMAKVAKASEGACKGNAGRLQAGQWGSTAPPDANLLAKDPAVGGTIEFDCAMGTIEGPLDVSGDGAFKWKGTWRFEGGPQPIVPPPAVVKDVVYTGKTAGDTLVLNILFLNTGMMQGPYTLTLGKVAMLKKCQ